MSGLQISIHSPAGDVCRSELVPGEYRVGSGECTQIRIPFEGVAEEHVLLGVGTSRLTIEPLAPGVSVNSDPIQHRVEVEFPASVECAGVMLILEKEPTLPGAHGEMPGGALPEASSLGASNAEEEAPLRGSYRLTKEIARGGMGQVFLAKDVHLGREVAVKVSGVAYAGEDPRLTREALVLAQLAHPNIVPVYALGVDGQGRPFYSMKLVKGRTLQEILDALAAGDVETERTYPLPARLTIFRKVCDAMAFAHSQGALHRDLKPANIMVGEFGEVLVMDWGLAKMSGLTEVPTPCAPSVGASRAPSGELGLTLEGEIMGTPAYMSPEQAEGKMGELDARSDIYALGGILGALLTFRPPVEGATQSEVLTNVRTGQVSQVLRKDQKGKRVGSGVLGGGEKLKVPEALRAVAIKAMALAPELRYASVEALVADIDAYQNGFATSAEEAGLWKKATLWMTRHKTLSGFIVVLAVVVSGFTARVVQKGREASEALRSLRETAPTFIARARDALQDGNARGALQAATYAVKLQPQNGEYHLTRANVLQALLEWEDALKEYRAVLKLGESPQAVENLELTQSLLLILKKDPDGATKAKVVLYDMLIKQGRQAEAMEVGKGMGDYWKARGRDTSAIPELVKRLEEKLLPVPGTEIRLCSTEFTVGEWKLYLRAEGLPGWQQPSRNWTQTDEHPVVFISWETAKAFCDWLTLKTGKKWRLPTNAEWDAAVGNRTYPWGETFPPRWDEGNYSVEPDGALDPKRVGVDGIFGTAPVASFKPNALGFYDLGGNAWEWTEDKDPKSGDHTLRGSSWYDSGWLHSSRVKGNPPTNAFNSYGFRVAREGP